MESNVIKSNIKTLDYFPFFSNCWRSMDCTERRNVGGKWISPSISPAHYEKGGVGQVREGEGRGVIYGWSLIMSSDIKTLLSQSFWRKNPCWSTYETDFRNMSTTVRFRGLKSISYKNGEAIMIKI